MKFDRETELMKKDYFGDKANPRDMIVTFRSRRRGKDLYFKYKTLVLRSPNECTLIEWEDELQAVEGHNRLYNDVRAGRPLTSIMQ